MYSDKISYMHAGKQKLRQKLHRERISMNVEAANKKSRIITEKLLDTVEWSSISRMHIYSSVPDWNEVDTKQIITIVRERWPHIAVTARPAKKDEPFPTEKYDLIVVPVLSFDKDNYRLGLGGGWYDKFLANQKQAETIGLAYAAAEIDILPREPHDIALDTIITEL